MTTHHNISFELYLGARLQ